MKFPSILTASNFVAAVQAVAFHVAVVTFRDALFIATAGELVVTARRSRGRRRAVLLVAVVRAVLVAVATPQLADALLIIAAELVGFASVRTCRNGRAKRSREVLIIKYECRIHSAFRWYLSYLLHRISSDPSVQSNLPSQTYDLGIQSPLLQVA